MPPACGHQRSYRSNSPILTVTAWSSGSNRARACPRESGGQQGSVCHSLAPPSRTVARLVARRTQKGMDASQPALAVSRLPGAAHECPPAPPARLLGGGTRRHYQACRCSYPAAQFRDASPGAEDRYPGHPEPAPAKAGVLLGHKKLDTTALYTRVAISAIGEVTSPLDFLLKMPG